ncbi:cation transporter, partial [Phaeodactylibacter sp.]
MANDIVELKVEGMTCNNCAASLNKFLERKGLEEVYVNFQTKEVRYRETASGIDREKVRQGIHKLGFSVVDEDSDTKGPWWTLERKLLISAIFTFPLLMYHFFMMAGVELAIMENYWFQMALCLPPFVIGFLHFGRSALSSLKGGVPNMDVLIFVGSTAAFVYSLVGTLLWEANYIFYETSATIVTLVLVGNWLEKRAVEQTTTAIGELTKLQVET